MKAHEEMLRKLAVRDDAFVDRLLGNESANMEEAHLDPKTRALVSVGALVAVDAAPPSYMEAVESARRWGATDDEVAGCLVAVLSTVGIARVVAAAPKVALALGYDVEAALEDPEHAADRR